MKKPKFKKCNFCNKEFKPYTSLDKFCSSMCRIDNIKSKRKFNHTKETCENRSGINNPSYRNGFYTRKKKKTAVGQREFNRVIKKIRSDMIDDKGFVYCEHCQTSNTARWEGHHLVYRSEKTGHDNLHKKENIINLCIKCHNEFHKNKHINRAFYVKERDLVELFGSSILPSR